MVVLLWGMLVVLSFIGWGRLVARILHVTDSDYGLDLVWGLAGLLGMSGAALAVGIATRLCLSTVIVAGVVFFFLFRQGRERKDSVINYFTIAVLALMMLVQALPSLLSLSYHAADDQAAYLAFPSKILNTGSLLESLSIRRQASLGGQSLLLALLHIGAPFEHLNFLDKGLCRVALAIVAVSAIPCGKAIFRLPLAAYILFLPNLSPNLSSMFSGALSFFGLYRTLVWCSLQEKIGLKQSFILALAALSPCTFRHNNIPVALLMIVCFHVLQVTRSDLRGLVRSLFQCLLILGILLFPWIASTYSLSPSDMFPWKASSDLSMGVFRAADYGDVVRQLLDSVATYAVPRGILIICAGFLLSMSLSSRDRAPSLAVWCAVSAGWVVTSFVLANVCPKDINRYDFGFVTGAIAASMLIGTEQIIESLEHLKLTLRFVLSAMILLFMIDGIVSSFPAFQKNFLALGNMAEPLSKKATESARYGRMQASIPEGSRIVSMVDDYYLLNFARNPIESLDLPGGVIPTAGKVGIHTGRHLHEILVSRKFTHLAYSIPENATGLYSLSQWERLAHGEKMEWFYRDDQRIPWSRLGSVVVRYFDMIHQLSKVCRTVYDDGTLRVLDLENCGETP